MKIKKQLIKRDIAGDTILVPVGKTVYDSNGLFVLNELATFIWDILPSAENAQQIVEKILEEYEVTKEQAAADTAEFLGKLKELQVID
ncbi:MAG: PqqD family protein [Oscillospiraceae bacterium]|nr:PqqD family protein [Oscillospiraceae bacterium]